jgi:hypothetical protein
MTHANADHRQLTQGFKSRITSLHMLDERVAFPDWPPKRCDMSTHAPLWTRSSRAFAHVTEERRVGRWQTVKFSPDFGLRGRAA